jgi:hypothetical protein
MKKIKVKLYRKFSVYDFVTGLMLGLIGGTIIVMVAYLIVY